MLSVPQKFPVSKRSVFACLVIVVTAYMYFLVLSGKMIIRITGILGPVTNYSLERQREDVRTLVATKTSVTPINLNNTSTIRANQNSPIFKQADHPVRKDTCESCFQHQFSYVINNERLCSVEGNTSIDLIILITSTHSNTHARKVLRDTWLSVAGNNTGNVRYAFLLGETKNETLRKDILEESAKYHDVIKEDFIDSYRNLTLKTLMAMKWASHFCKHSKFVMKTDDDMYVNINKLLSYIRSLKPSSKHVIYGACWKGSPHRDVRSKWYVPVNLYPHKAYPRFCSGTGYFMSTRTSSSIYNISQNVPFFYLEDVYVGLCVKALGGNAQSVGGFFDGKKKGCMNRNSITIHGYKPAELEKSWNHQC